MNKKICYDYKNVKKKKTRKFLKTRQNLKVTFLSTYTHISVADHHLGAVDQRGKAHTHRKHLIR